MTDNLTVTTVEPVLHTADAEHHGMLVWKWRSPMVAMSSAPVGGGISRVEWAANIGVPLAYNRVDIDNHAAEVAAALGLTGRAMTMFTAADVSMVRRGLSTGAVAHATVGLSKPTWAAAPTDHRGQHAPGTLSQNMSSPSTINIVVQIPVGLCEAAAVNAVMTVTEAKTQALADLGVPGTGTASDATAVIWPADAPTERFAGPRSLWGARIARAAHKAVSDGATSWITCTMPTTRQASHSGISHNTAVNASAGTPKSNTVMITLILGGTRSGKSERAERIAGSYGIPVTYVVPSTASPGDSDYAERVAAHQARRPSEWDTVECATPADLPVLLRRINGVALVDSLGSWVAGIPNLRVSPRDEARLLMAIQTRTWPTVMVSDEVGMSVHPPTAAGRRFTDILGSLNQQVAAVADRVLLLVAGRAVELPEPAGIPETGSATRTP